MLGTILTWFLFGIYAFLTFSYASYLLIPIVTEYMATTTPDHLGCIGTTAFPRCCSLGNSIYECFRVLFVTCYYAAEPIVEFLKVIFGGVHNPHD